MVCLTRSFSVVCNTKYSTRFSLLHRSCSMHLPLLFSPKCPFPGQLSVLLSKSVVDIVVQLLQIRNEKSRQKKSRSIHQASRIYFACDCTCSPIPIYFSCKTCRHLTRTEKKLKNFFFFPGMFYSSIH